MLKGYVFAQTHNRFPENLPNLDKQPYHFGIIIGFNEMNFVVNTKDYRLFDSLNMVESMPEKGFQLGVVANLRLAERLDLRFIPSLSFGERILYYKIMERGTVPLNETKKIESTFLEFPFLLKYKSARFLINSRAYLLGGAKYTLDLASQANKKENNIDEVTVKLLKNDICYEVGVGFDFYFEYFKFGTELKMSYGIKDILKRENNIYTSPVSRLNSKVFILSFTFEG